MMEDLLVGPPQTKIASASHASQHSQRVLKGNSSRLLSSRRST